MKPYFLFLFVCFFTSISAQNSSKEDATFIEFLKKNNEKKTLTQKEYNSFNHTAWTYWHAHKLDYNLHPKKYKKAIALFHEIQEKNKKDNTPKIDRFENTIHNFKRFDVRNTLPKEPILFVGSSSIVYWETSKSFPKLPVINRGFGGASIPEIMHYYDAVIKKHKPTTVVFYCDIDVENGKSPEFAVNAFKKLTSRIQQDFPKTNILVLPMKPTLIDDFIGKSVRKNKNTANKMLRGYCKQHKNLHFVDITKPMLEKNNKLRSDIFLSDGMHLNALGYTFWSPIIRNKILELKKI